MRIVAERISTASTETQILNQPPAACCATLLSTLGLPRTSLMGSTVKVMSMRGALLMTAKDWSERRTEG